MTDQFNCSSLVDNVPGWDTDQPLDVTLQLPSFIAMSILDAVTTGSDDPDRKNLSVRIHNDDEAMISFTNEGVTIPIIKVLRVQ